GAVGRQSGQMIRPRPPGATRVPQSLQRRQRPGIWNPRGLLMMMARRRVYAHYALARVRREEATDYSDARAMARLASWIGAA
ncbi:hypothetical protein ACWCQZ_51175, partial [Streptomyces sp. NPDC002285]